MRPLLAFLASVNAAAIAVALRGRERAAVMAVAAAAAWAVALVLAAASEPVLDALDVTPETFRTAAGAVVALFGARWVLLRVPACAEESRPGGWTRVGAPLLVPLLVTPPMAMVSISVGVDDGVAVAALAAACAFAIAWVASRTAGGTLWSVAVRFVGALGIAVGLAIVVDGVRAV